MSNIGSGAALNLRLVRTKVESVDWEAKSNFGEPAMGAAVAVGQLVDTRSAPGSVGNLRDENLHLIYESLSRKVYASIITFNIAPRLVQTRSLRSGRARRGGLRLPWHVG